MQQIRQIPPRTPLVICSELEEEAQIVRMLNAESDDYVFFSCGKKEVDYIRVYLHTLRLKLEEDPRHPTYLETITGVEYRFRQSCISTQ